jgi:hypothetical protein
MLIPKNAEWLVFGQWEKYFTKSYPFLTVKNNMFGNKQIRVPLESRNPRNAAGRPVAGKRRNAASGVRTRLLAVGTSAGRTAAINRSPKGRGQRKAKK